MFYNLTYTVCVASHSVPVLLIVPGVTFMDDPVRISRVLINSDVDINLYMA